MAPASAAASGFDGCVAGMPLNEAGLIPRKSRAVAIVLAVNWPPHAPAPGQAAPSSEWRSSADSDPAACCPTASNTSWIVTSLSRQRPGAIDPL
jgi:hypothetical protein